MITLAIQNIRPNCNWYIEGETYDKLVWTDTEKTKPTEEEINIEIERITQERIRLQYQRNRAANYPSITDQLDMLYHDIKNGTLNSGNWIQAIEAVKTEYPKP